MKKLKLDFNDFKGSEVLTREQLKRISGGSGAGGTCAVTWNSANQTGSINNITGSSLTGVVQSDGSTTYTLYGTSKDIATNAFANGGAGAHWCCDSCSSASWYNP